MDKKYFELTDGKTVRQSYFKKVSMADGLKIMTAAPKVAESNAAGIEEFAELAVKYLVLIEPETKIEQDIKSTAELDAVFDNPMMLMKILEEFERYLAPYIESLNLSSSKTMELKKQALQ